MDDRTLGLVGGIVGSVVGLLGAVAGTSVDLENTKGPRQRASMIRAAVAGWLWFAAFLACPIPWRPLLRLVWMPSLFSFVREWNERQSLAQVEDQAEAGDGSPGGTTA